MINEKLKAYVEKADTDSVRVRVIDHAIDADLRAIGFSQTTEQDVYVLDVLGDKHKAQVFDTLRVLEVAFSAGKEWCPAEVFEYLRDDLGLLSGRYLRVAWTQPGQYRLTTV